VFTTSGTYPWSFVTQIFHNGQVSSISVIFLIRTSSPTLDNHLCKKVALDVLIATG